MYCRRAATIPYPRSAGAYVFPDSVVGGDGQIVLIGRAYYLPQTPLNSRTMAGLGNTFLGSNVSLKPIAEGGCVNGTPTTGGTSMVSSYHDTESYTTSLSTEANLDAKGSATKNFSLNATVKERTTSSSTTNLDIQTATYDYSSIGGSISLGKCIDDLSSLFQGTKNAFNNLPVITGLKLNDPFNPGTAGLYTNFIKTHGSHILTQMSTGRRFLQQSSLSSYGSDVSTLLSVEACVKVNGVTPEGQFDVNGCGSVDKQTASQAKSLNSTDYRLVRGGEPELNAQLQTGMVTAADAQKFLLSDPINDEAILFTFRPIWEVLQNMLDNDVRRGRTTGISGDSSADYARIITLQAVYEGWLSHACTTVTGASSDDIVRQMRVTSLTPEGYALWGCWARHDGCYKDNDCHWDYAYTMCKCDGNGCYTHDEELEPVKWYGREHNGYVGPNNACSYGWSMDCGCNPNASWGGDYASAGDRWIYQQQ